MKPREPRHTWIQHKTRISLLCRGFTAFLVLLNASGCSPKSLFDIGGSNDSKATITNYQPINRACSHLDLSAPNLRGQELRALLKCFNAYGALDPIQKLFDRLSDEQVNSLVQLGNQYVLNDPTFLYDLKQTYSDEKNTGALDESMQSVSLLLQNPDLITAIFSLLDTAQNTKGQNLKVLKILQAIGNHLNANSTTEGMSFGMNLASSKAFASLQTELQSSSSSSNSSANTNANSPDLETLTDGFYRLLQDTETVGPSGQTPFSLIDNLNELAQSGDLFEGVDKLIGTSSQEIASNVPALVPILPTLSANDGVLFDGMQELVHSLQSPLLCLNGTKSVPDPVLHLFSEISNTPDGGGGDYIRRTHLLTIVAMTPFCKFQPEVETQYQSLVKFASSPAMYGTEKVIKSFFSVKDANGTHPLSKLIENFLGDPANPEKTPIMAELSNRNAWADIFLLASLPGPTDRTNMISALSFLADPAPELGGESIKDAMTDLVLAGGSDKLFAVVNALKGYVNQTDPLAYPVLDGFRNAFYSNDVHPFLDFTRKILVDAPNRALFFNSLFSLSEYPEFKPAIQLLSQIAKDGRLKTIYGDASVVFAGLAKPGKHPVNPDVALPFSPDRRHNLSAADLTDSSAQTTVSGQSSQTTSRSDVCALLTPEVSLADMSDTKLFNRQWDRFLNCLAEKGDYRDVKSDVDYLRSQKTDDGRSDLVFGIDLIRDFSKSVTKSELNDLGNLWVSGEDNGKFNRWLDQASAWVSHQVTQPLLNLIRPLMTQAQSDIQEVERFAAKILRQDNFPALLLEVDRLSLMKPNPESEVKPVDFDLARVNRWIENKECENTPNPNRATEIVRDYEYGVTSFEYVNQAYEPKFSWTFDEVKNLTEPVLQKFANPEQSNPDHTMTDAVIDFLTFFSLKKGQAPNSAQHFTPDVLANWFYDRANDKKLITQYYLGDPPEAQPRVRYFDGLDRLEAVLVNADFDSLAPVLDKLGVKLGVNIGKMSLAEIGDSWGDEPYEIWPEEIKRKYAGKTPPTLRKTIEHVGDIMNWLKVGVGFPKLPHCSQQADPNDSPEVRAEELSNNEPVCGWIPAIAPFPSLPTCLNMPDISEFDLRNIKRRLYNIAQVYDVMLDNLPDSGKPEQGGMKVLRDLFFQFNYSTPVEYRGQLEGARNNLSFITFLAKTGIDRQLAFELRKLNRNDPMFHNFFGALVSLARAPGAKHLLEQLLVNDTNHELIWNLAKSFYPLMGNAFSENGNPIAEPRKDSLRMKQTLMYGVAALEKEKLVNDAVVGISSILDQDASIISSHSDSIAEKTADLNIAWLARAYFVDKEAAGKTALTQVASEALKDPVLLKDALNLFQTLTDNPEIKKDWDAFHAKLNSMEALSSFKQINTTALNRDLLSFFEQRNTSFEDNQTEKAIRLFAADHLESGDLDRVLELVAKDPTHFEKLLDTLSKYVKNGQLKNFFSYLRREMKPVN